MKAQRNKLLLNVLGGFVIFLSLVSIASVLGNRGEAVSLLREGVTTTGTVTDLSTVAPKVGLPRRTARQSRDNFVRVAFTDDEGKRQEQTATRYVGWPEYKDLKIGDAVKVTYRKGSPYNLYLRASLDRLAGSLWGAWLAGAGLLVGTGMIVAAARIRLP